MCRIVYCIPLIFYSASGIDNFDNGAYKTGTVKHFNRTI